VKKKQTIEKQSLLWLVIALMLTCCASMAANTYINSEQQPIVWDEPDFDGILKAASDGRAEAYLQPLFPSNHASNLEILPNHDVLLAWFSGSKVSQFFKSLSA
jgi:hypothetical protein